MEPVARLAPSVCGTIRGVLADIDDTITSDGRLTAEAYAAMERIQAAGLWMIPITGRPAGWCDHIARMWPVDAVVGENGAFWFRYDHASRTMRRRFIRDDEARRHDGRQLQDIAREVLDRVPGAKVSADQLYRAADLAIDFCEDVPRLSERDIDCIVDVMQARGLTVKVSSIHVNGWFGSHDKLTTTRSLLMDEFGCGEASLAREFAYIGDSPNDEPMFAFFECAVGVANVTDLAARISHLPRYVTLARSGSGFAEFADALIRGRTSSQSGSSER